jgi:hypothetical protein
MGSCPRVCHVAPVCSGIVAPKVMCRPGRFAGRGEDADVGADADAADARQVVLAREERLDVALERAIRAAHRLADAALDLDPDRCLVEEAGCLSELTAHARVRDEHAAHVCRARRELARRQILPLPGPDDADVLRPAGGGIDAQLQVGAGGRTEAEARVGAQARPHRASHREDARVIHREPRDERAPRDADHVRVAEVQGAYDLEELLAHADLAVLEADREEARLRPPERETDRVRQLAHRTLAMQLELVNDRVCPDVARDLEQGRADVAAVAIDEEHDVLAAHDAERALDDPARRVGEVVVHRRETKRWEGDPSRTRRGPRGRAGRARRRWRDARRPRRARAHGRGWRRLARRGVRRTGRVKRL